MEIIIIIIVLFILLSLIFLGKGRSVILNLDGFSDSFELVDFHHELAKDSETLDNIKPGKLSAPYKAWDNQQCKLKLNCYIKFGLFDIVFFFTRLLRIPVFIEIKNVKTINGFSVYYKDKDGIIYTEASDAQRLIYSSKTGRNFEITIFINQDTIDIPLNDPTYMEFTIELSVNSGLLFSKSKTSELKYGFFIGPELGSTWIGLDPGTTGSCISAASNLQNITIAKDDQDNDLIIPSIISFDTTLDFNDNKIEDLYLVGDNALAKSSMEGMINFHSIKKMLGFDFKQKIKFSNEASLNLSGKELSSILIKEILQSFLKFLERNPKKYSSLLLNDHFEPKRVVVSIPNNFTASKIQELVSSIQDLHLFKEIRYIYEAEAVLLYYLFDYKSDKKPLNENILVFDMGGTSINISIARTSEIKNKNRSNYKIDILGKLGYAVGGDNLDYCLLKYLYDYDETQYSKLGTFDLDDTDSRKQDRTEIKSRLLELKMKIIENYYDETKSNILNDFDFSDIFEYPAFNDTSELVQNQKKDNKNLNSIIRNKYTNEIIYENIKGIVNDIFKICDNIKLDTVLFSGRTTLFPEIKETVIQTVLNNKQDPEFANFEANELKSIVSKGACLYGIYKDGVKITNLKANASFGFKKTYSFQDIRFIPLIEIGTQFKNSKIQEIINWQPDSFASDNNNIEYYQVMDRSSKNIFNSKNKHKYSLLTKIKVGTKINELGIRVFENDRIDCGFKETNGELSFKDSFVNDQDIFDANEEHYTWILE